MTSMPVGLFVKKLQPKVGLRGYDILNIKKYWAYGLIIQIQHKISFQDPRLYPKGPSEGKIVVFNKLCHKNYIHLNIMKLVVTLENFESFKT